MNMAMNASGIGLDMLDEHINNLFRAIIWDRRAIIIENFIDSTPNRIEHVADIVRKIFGHERIYDRKTHREIYPVLLGQLKNLHDGKYRRTSGVVHHIPL